MEHATECAIQDAARTLFKIRVALERLVKPEFREFVEAGLGGGDVISISRLAIRSFEPAGDPSGSSTLVSFVGVYAEDSIFLAVSYTEFKLWMEA